MEIVLDFVLDFYYNRFHKGIDESEMGSRKKKARKTLLFTMYILILFIVGYLLYKFQ